MWLTLPDDVDGDRLARSASECGVTVLAGSKFFASPTCPHPKNHLRIAYSHATLTRSTTASDASRLPIAR